MLTAILGYLLDASGESGPYPLGQTRWNERPLWKFISVKQPTADCASQRGGAQARTGLGYGLEELKGAFFGYRRVSTNMQESAGEVRSADRRRPESDDGKLGEL
jgi:hypothetical protein